MFHQLLCWGSLNASPCSSLLWPSKTSHFLLLLLLLLLGNAKQRPRRWQHFAVSGWTHAAVIPAGIESELWPALCLSALTTCSFRFASLFASGLKCCPDLWRGGVSLQYKGMQRTFHPSMTALLEVSTLVASLYGVFITLHRGGKKLVILRFIKSLSTKLRLEDTLQQYHL